MKYEVIKKYKACIIKTNLINRLKFKGLWGSQALSTNFSIYYNMHLSLYHNIKKSNIKEI